MDEELLAQLYPEYDEETNAHMSIIDLNNPNGNREVLDTELIQSDYVY